MKYFILPILGFVIIILIYTLTPKRFTYIQDEIAFTFLFLILIITIIIGCQ